MIGLTVCVNSTQRMSHKLQQTDCFHQLHSLFLSALHSQEQTLPKSFYLNPLFIKASANGLLNGAGFALTLFFFLFFGFRLRF